MKNLTLKSFCQKSYITESLVRSTVRQIGGWSAFKNYAQDVTNYGAQGGFCGFTYYADTVKFTKRNKTAILEFCKQFANDIGEGGMIEFISNFNCMKNYSQEEVADGIYNPRSESKTTVYNVLAWFILEEVSRSYCDLMEC
jgi:hypothetical protein